MEGRALSGRPSAYTAIACAPSSPLLVASPLVGANLVASAGAAGSGAGGVECPSSAVLLFPANLREAIPATKTYSFGRRGRVSRGDGSIYAVPARKACGGVVLKDS